MPEGVEQAQNQDNTGATGGQTEPQNDGTAEGLQDQTSHEIDNALANLR